MKEHTQKLMYLYSVPTFPNIILELSRKFQKVIKNVCFISVKYEIARPLTIYEDRTAYWQEILDQIQKVTVYVYFEI